ncbi:hypothetical protein LXL04_020932 [Taraxacum kok-saghyz]
MAAIFISEVNDLKDMIDQEYANAKLLAEAEKRNVKNRRQRGARRGYALFEDTYKRRHHLIHFCPKIIPGNTPNRSSSPSVAESPLPSKPSNPATSVGSEHTARLPFLPRPNPDRDLGRTTPEKGSDAITATANRHHNPRNGSCSTEVNTPQLLTPRASRKKCNQTPILNKSKEPCITRVRVKSRQGLKLLILDNDGNLAKNTTNVVYNERAVQMRTIIGGGNGGTNLGHLFQFAADQFSDAGALLSVQHIMSISLNYGDSKRLGYFRNTRAAIIGILLQLVPVKMFNMAPVLLKICEVDYHFGTH